MDLGIIISSLVVSEAGYINHLVLTKNGYEMMAGCENGIFFVQLDSTKRAMELLEERYFAGKLVSQIFEFSPMQLIISIFSQDGYFVIDRPRRKVMQMKKCISLSTPDMDSDDQSEEKNVNCTDIKPLPGFHIESFPYLLTRT